MPIVLKDGGVAILPSSETIYLVHEPVAAGQPVSFSSLSDATSIVIYAGLVDAKKAAQKNVEDIITENKFEFKSNIEI